MTGPAIGQEVCVLDARRLEIFCSVAEEGSFTAAAARLHLTQSAVSQQVAILERDIGMLLMERVPRGIKLTPDRQAAERARPVAAAGDVEPGAGAAPDGRAADQGQARRVRDCRRASGARRRAEIPATP
ncbi:MAG: LysR family transcriptional regulator [Aliidongia sp.]